MMCTSMLMKDLGLECLSMSLFLRYTPFNLLILIE